MATFTLSELQYDDDRTGSLKLYVYGPDGVHHRGGQWFRKIPRYPDEEITAEAARVLTEAAMADGREVRICNGGDFLVFHAKGAEVIHPKVSAEAFWDSL